MKLIYLFIAIFFPAFVFAQQPDTAGVSARVDSLNEISFAFTKKLKNDEALTASEAAERLALEKLGKESPEYARARFYHGLMLTNNTKKYEEAEQILLEAKHIQEKLLGLEHPDYAATLYQLSFNYYYRGEVAEALASVTESLRIREKVLGTNNEAYEDCIYMKAFILRRTGDFDNAEPLMQQWASANEKRFGKTSYKYARSLNDLALLYYTMTEYQKAEVYLNEALQIMENTIGKTDIRYAKALTALGNIYNATGKLGKAETCLLDALAIRKKGVASPTDQSNLLTSLGTVYSNLGNFDKAASFYLEAAELVSEESPGYIGILEHLSHVYLKKGDLKSAEQYFQRTLDRLGKVSGKASLPYANAKNFYAQLFITLGNYPKAEQLLMECIEIIESNSLPKSTVYANILINLGSLYIKMDSCTKAEPLLQEAKSVIEKTTGKESLNYQRVLFALTSVYWNQKKLSTARPFLIENIERERKSLITSTQYLSEQELLTYIQTYSSITNWLFSLGQLQPDMSPVCYDNILFHKGFLLNTSAQIRRLANSDSASAEAYQSLQAVRNRLATEYSMPFTSRDSVRLISLEEKANTLEKELVSKVAGYSNAIHQVQWQEIQAALRPGEAAIEFVDYKLYVPKTTDSVMYAALLIRPDDTQPLLIPLFEKKEIMPLLYAATGGNNFMRINALYASKSSSPRQKSLYELIWKPLEQYLKNSATLYCSPSGLVHYLNLAAIPSPDGKPYGDTRQIILLRSTRSLAIPDAVPEVNSTEAYLVGGIRYDSDSTAMTYASRAVETRNIETNSIAFQPDSTLSRTGKLNYLPATAVEVHEIGQILSTARFRAKVDTGFYASEEAFRSFGIGKPSPRILHLATHGYFFPDPKVKNSRENYGAESVFKMSEHPMIRSGLILAGAKQAWITGKHPEGKEDGILTAYEISQMNLSGTELVVLSACETGLGQVSGNEGVYGLQRAFKIAGAKYLIMSLWKVDDRSTQVFMVEFYRQWLQKGKPIPQAFQSAQQVMRAKSPNPYDWAGFILID